MNNFLNFIGKSVSQYHATEEMANILKAEGFVEIFEENSNKLELGGKYFVTRNHSSIIAFCVPTTLDNLSVNITATHTDSPTFKLKPNNKLVLDGNYTSLNTEVYGGPIYSSFFDRPLSLAGRAFVKTNGQIEERLVNVDRDLLVIPNECIHFNRDVNSGKNYNPQIDLLPLLGDETADLDKILRETLNLDEVDRILSHDLQIYNRFRGTIFGANKEYFMAPQIDNLESAYGTLMGFVKSNNNESFNVWASFDNEEVGSHTKQGAGSRFLADTLQRAFASIGLSNCALLRALSTGLFVSCDNAHAVHPNDLGKTDRLNKVYMNKGIVIKYNANQSYTTDALSSALIKDIFDNSNVSYQEFTNRSDVRGGGTLGAISQGLVSMPSVDIGLPQLAMHSACETAGVKDLDTLIKGMEAFYNTKIVKTGNNYKLN